MRQRRPFPAAVAIGTVVMMAPLLLSAASAQGRSGGPGRGGAVAAPEFPGCQLNRNGGVLDGTGADRSFERIVDTSPIIVEATVQSTTPGRSLVPNAPNLPNGGPREMDVTLVAVRALKGAAPDGPFVVARLPASGFFDMQPRQRFILFLGQLDDRAKEAYAASLTNRFRLNMAATLCVDDARAVHVSPEGSFLRQLESLPLTTVVEEITTYATLPRVRGRIEIDGGTFPPENVPMALPTTLPITVAAPALLRVVAAPSEASSDLRLAIATYRPLARTDAAAPAGTSVSPAPASPRNAPITRTGEFELALAEGSYRVSIEGIPLGYTLKALTYSLFDMRREALVVDRFANADLIVTLTPANAGTTVSGRMTGIPPGADQRDMAVFIVPDGTAGPGPLMSPLSADGTFRFNQIPPGRYHLMTRASIPVTLGSAGTPSSVPVIVGAQPVVQDLPIFEGAPGTLEFAAGSAALNTTVFVRFAPPGGGSPITIMLRDTPTTFWLPAGEYAVTVTANGPNGGTSLRATLRDTELSGKTVKSDGVTPLPPVILSIF